VAVIGAGPLGLMMMHLAVLADCRVMAVVKYAEHAAVARDLGVQDVIETTATADVVRSVRERTAEGRGVDVAIEAVALPETWEQAVAMVRQGGMVNFFGGPAAGTKVCLDTNRLHYGDITLKATFHHTPEVCRRAFALLASGRFKADRLLTGEAELENLPAVFREWGKRQGEIKTVILPRAGETESGVR
jgi:L-iditol 2-dehydrogenase